MSTAPIKHTPDKPPAKHSSKESKPGLDSYYTRLSGRFRIAKYAVSMLLVVFLIFSFTFLRKDITLENLRYLLKFISFTNTETSITASRIQYPSGDPNRLELFLGDLCTLSPEGYAIYDSNGNQIMSEAIKYASPVLKTGARFAMCYDMNGTAYTILNTFSKLYEGTTEYPITDADITDSGSFAVASSSREYRTAITVYDDDFSPVTRIYKNDHLMALEFKNDASQLAIMTVGAGGGEFYTNIDVIVPGKDRADKSAQVQGLGYSFYYTDSGYIVVTDEAICFFDEALKPTRTYLHDSHITMSHCSDKYITTVYNDGVMGNSYIVRVHDTKGSLIYEEKLDGKLIALDGDDSGEYIFVLIGDTVTRINMETRKSGTLQVEKDAIDLLVSDKDTILLCMKNHALTYELANFEEAYFDAPKQSSNASNKKPESSVTEKADDTEIHNTDTTDISTDEKETA